MSRTEEKYQYTNHVIKNCLLFILYISYISLLVPKAGFLTQNTSVSPKSFPAKAVTCD